MFKLTYLLTISLSYFLLTSCSEEPELNARTASLDGKSGGSGNGVFKSSCTLAGGSIGCKLVHIDTAIKLDHSSLNLLPTFDSHLVDDTSSIDAVSLGLESSDFTLSSRPPRSSEYTFIFKFTEDMTTLPKLYEKLSAAGSNPGIAMNIPQKLYNSESKKILTVNKCLTGLVFHSWLNKDASFTDFDIKGFDDEDFRYVVFIPFDSQSQAINDMAIPNTDKWKKAFESITSNYIDSSCSSEKTAYDSGESPQSLKDFEAAFNDLMYHYIVTTHNASKESLASAAGYEFELK